MKSRLVASFYAVAFLAIGLLSLASTVLGEGPTDSGRLVFASLGIVWICCGLGTFWLGALERDSSPS